MELFLTKMPWITKGLLVSVRKRNKLYKKYMGNRTLQRELHYKRYKIKLNHLIRNAKKTYYDNKFDRAKGDLKETWRLINEVINTKSKQSSLPSSFKSNGIAITDPFEIANGFLDTLLTLAHPWQTGFSQKMAFSKISWDQI